MRREIEVEWLYFTYKCMKTTKLSMGMVWVAARWQLANAEVDDDQRHSTLLLQPLLERLLEELKIGVRNT